MVSGRTKPGICVLLVGGGLSLAMIKEVFVCSVCGLKHSDGLAILIHERACKRGYTVDLVTAVQKSCKDRGVRFSWRMVRS